MVAHTFVSSERRIQMSSYTKRGPEIKRWFREEGAGGGAAFILRTALCEFELEGTCSNTSN